MTIKTIVKPKCIAEAEDKIKELLSLISQEEDLSGNMVPQVNIPGAIRKLPDVFPDMYRVGSYDIFSDCKKVGEGVLTSNGTFMEVIYNIPLKNNFVVIVSDSRAMNFYKIHKGLSTLFEDDELIETEF